jgi:hypothetical protein
MVGRADHTDSGGVTLVCTGWKKKTVIVQDIHEFLPELRIITGCLWIKIWNWVYHQCQVPAKSGKHNKISCPNQRSITAPETADNETTKCVIKIQSGRPAASE